MRRYCSPGAVLPAFRARLERRGQRDGLAIADQAPARRPLRLVRYPAVAGEPGHTYNSPLVPQAPQAPRPSSRDTDGLQLASSWTRDGVEFNAARSGGDKLVILASPKSIPDSI